MTHPKLWLDKQIFCYHASISRLFQNIEIQNFFKQGEKNTGGSWSLSNGTLAA